MTKLRSSAMPPLQRRAVLKALGIGAAWGAGSLQAAAPAGHASALDGSAAAWRALSRVGYGPTPRLARTIHDQASARAWVLQQLDAAHAAAGRAPMLPAEWSGFNAPLPTLFEGARKEREALRQVRGDATDDNNPAVQRQLRQQFLTDMGPRYFNLAMLQQAAAWRLTSASQPQQEPPLLARLTEFWFNHFNVYARKGAVRPFVGHYAVNVARAHALGKIEDLLLACARHPAMLFYLDQFQSVADGTRGRDGQARGLNENYARELMELHTLGADGGYTQTDVRELARILTGWTVSQRDADGFQFIARLHDGGNKSLLGHQFPRGLLGAGEREGEDAIRMLARHPSTARRVCTRLAQYFVCDQPPAALVQQLSKTFLASQGELHVVLRELLQSPDFWAAGNTLFKTPLDFAVSSLAAVQDDVGDAVAAIPERQRIGLTLAFLNEAGQPMHSWQTPDGYRFDAATWMVPEALTRRADFALALARHAPEPVFLRPYLSSATLDTIANAPPALRAGLMLASPDFMRK